MSIRCLPATRACLLSSATVLALCAAPAVAQEHGDDLFQMLGRIIFCAGTAKVASDTPQAVTALEQEDLDRKQASTIGELLKGVSGVQSAGASARPKEKAASVAVASAPKGGAKTKDGGGMSPAAYAKAVRKKVRATGKKSGGGKGTAVVGFTIGVNGGLAGVEVLQGSGNAALDKIAPDHIRTSALFPAPPADAGRHYAFEFVGK